MAKSKILILTDWYEPGYKAGGPIQSCKNIVARLAGKYDFFILTSDRDIGDITPYPDVVTDKWITVNNNLKIWYASPDKMTFRIFKQIVTDVFPDTVYLNSMFSQKYTLVPLFVLRHMKFKGRIAIAPRGMLHKGAMLRKTFKKKLFLNIIDTLGIANRLYFHATNEYEASDIQKYFRRTGGIIVAENIPNSDVGEWRKRSKIKGHLHCVFISRIHPKKNLHFAIETLLKMDPPYKVQFDIYGVVDDKVYNEECKKLASQAGANLNIEFKGVLTRDNIFHAFHKYHLFYLPTLGENFGHVIFEALSAGCPALISDQTHWTNVSEYNAGWALRLDEPKGFIGKLTEVCEMSEEELNKKSKAAYDYSRAYIRQQDLSEKYIQLFG